MEEFQERINKIERRDKIRAIVRNYIVIIVLSVATYIFG